MMFTIGVLIAILSAASWAMGTILFDKIGKVMPAAGITFFKSVMSVLLMTVLMLVFGFEIPTGRQLLFLALSGVIGISVGDTLFFRSLQHLGVKMQVLYFILGQVLTVILSYLFLGEILTLLQYIGAFVVVIGVLLVIFDKQDNHPNKTQGIIEGFAAMLCYSVSIILIKSVMDEVSAVTATFYRMLFSVVFVLLGGLFSKKVKAWAAPLRQRKTLALFTVNSVIVTYGGFLMSVLALKYIDVSIASILSTTEPLFTLLFAFLINKDKPTRKEMIGALIAMVGVLMMILFQ